MLLRADRRRRLFYAKRWFLRKFYAQETAVFHRFRVKGTTYGVYYRADCDADAGVIDQIFCAEEYRFSGWVQGRAVQQLYTLMVGADKQPLIVDAGANIGAATVYFARKFSRSRVYAVEPAITNCAVLKINAESVHAKVFEGAVGAKSGEMVLNDPGLGEWAFRTSHTGAGPKVNVYSPAGLLHLAEQENLEPFIFKADIEGAEGELFEGDSEWVSRFPLLILELHDWMLPGQHNSQNFLRTIASQDFDIAWRGENIFCFNNRLLRNLY